MLGLALLAALAIDSGRLHGAASSASSIFLPYAVPGVVATLCGASCTARSSAWSHDINKHARRDPARPAVPAPGSWPSIGNIVTWEFVGYNMLIFYSALRVVPADAVRGRGDRRRRRSSASSGRIKLPALRPALVIATIFSIIGSFQLFNEPSMLKHLAPNAITTYFTPELYAYNLSFDGQQFNYAATVAIVMGVVTDDHRLRRPAARHAKGGRDAMATETVRHARSARPPPLRARPGAHHSCAAGASR